MQITFLGATETVTGSKYLIEVDHHKFMIDCGLFQGLKQLRLRNWHRPPVKPESVEAVILTHAHIDHSGYLPLFAKNGFTGPIYCSPATKDLCQILLPDSAHIQEEETARANRYGYSKHHPALPLYTTQDAEHVLHQFNPIAFGQTLQLSEHLRCQLHHAGHILGASFVRLEESGGPSLLFSGDMGRFEDEVMRAPAFIDQVDYLVLESTYGDRLHDPKSPIDQLADIINRTVERGGSIIVPAFAVGRAQNLMYYVYELKRANRIPDIPVFLDSPMATSVTDLFVQYANEHHLTHEQARSVCESVTYVDSVEMSKTLDRYEHPVIIISASGMVTGGRVLHHIKSFGNDPKNTIVLTGFQAAGTRGERLIKGEKSLKMLGEYVHIRAEVLNLSNTSAHADQQELLDWLSHFSSPPRKVFLTHGEIVAQKALQAKITEQFGWDVEIPKYKSKFTLL